MDTRRVLVLSFLYKPTYDICVKETTHFGFQQVAVEEKADRVRGVFDSVAHKYDLMNDAMSGGLHRVWKKKMVGSLPLYTRQQMLDLAGGTGDISLRALKRFHQAGKSLDVTITDINLAMLEEGQKRALDENWQHYGSMRWQQADAQALEFTDHSFDIVTIAFGIRNVTHIDQALREIYRVLKPGGMFVCLEFSPVDTPIIKQIYDLYSFHLIPPMGQLLAKDRDSYQYLVESIRQFPTAEDFANKMREAGFCHVQFERLTAGVVALHRGVKI